MTDKKLPEKNKYYSAGAVVKEGFLGDWVKSRKHFTELLRTENVQSVFKPIIVKRGKYLSFNIKGENIIRVMEMIERGELII